MGTNASSLQENSTEQTPILTTENWSLHNAQHEDYGPVSVFVTTTGQSQTNLESLGKMISYFTATAYGI